MVGPNFGQGRGNLEPFIGELGVDCVMIDMFSIVGFDFVWLMYSITIWIIYNYYLFVLYYVYQIDCAQRESESTLLFLVRLKCLLIHQGISGVYGTTDRSVWGAMTDMSR